MNSDIIREHISRLLNWQEAHINFDKAVDHIPVEMRGEQPEGVPYSPWQLLEHMRITQFDILDFCQNPDYQEISWPDDYWPDSNIPQNREEWEKSVDQFRADRSALQQMAKNPEIDLTAVIPHGSGQTYLRELLLVADHTAYHVGQLIVVRRLLGIW